MAGQPEPWTTAAGEASVLVRFGTGIDLAVSRRVLACLELLDKRGLDALPAYASVLVHFDPLKVSGEEVAKWCREAAAEAAGGGGSEPRTVSIPVRYGGEDGPDMDEVARLTGLSTEEVVKAHAGGDYRVYFLGFLAGFPYLGGLGSPLSTVPRLATPRTKVPKGTVGIAGGQTGVYPVSTPGGWHCLGRTPKKLFDPTQDPPALLRAGDLVKFVPSDEAIPEEAEAAAAAPVPAQPWAQVLAPGPMTTVQDLGRCGYARHGVSRTGAADDLALRMGNALLGNEAGAAGLEVTMGGLKLQCSEPCAIALTGADCAAKLTRPGADPAPLPVNQVVLLRRGDEVELGFATDGLRAYVCVQGGVDVPAVLGSRATDLRAGLGGFQGRKLESGDQLGRCSTQGPPRLLSAAHDPLRGVAGKTWKVRVLPGPGDPSVAGATCAPSAELADREFQVLPRSDRMAVCLSPGDAADAPKLTGGQQLSEACVSGTIQLPPDGNPVILLAEHQTTGGYRVPAVVIKADLWQVGQMRPGESVRFVQVTQEEALAALRELRAAAVETKPTPAPKPAHVSYTLVPRSGDSMGVIDLNADAGEGYDDEGLLKYVTSVNVACGGHVGNSETMARTVALAVRAGAGIGAHPSFVDKEGFGRKKLDTPPLELRDQVLSQVSALDAICRAYGTRVRYIKPHGALYHSVLTGGEQGRAVWEAAQLLELPLLLMPWSPWATFGEGFAERAYDGEKLRSRDLPGAVIHDPAQAAQQAVSLGAKPKVCSICIHSDSPHAVPVAQAVRAALDQHFRVRTFAPPPCAQLLAQPSGVPSPDAGPAPLPLPSPAQRRAHGTQKTAAPGSLQAVLEDQVAPVVVNGYRFGEGVEGERYPVRRVCEAVAGLMRTLGAATVEPTAYTRFAKGEQTYDQYIAALRAQLQAQGGGWVTVAPRDTAQQGNDSESAAITNLSRRNAEVWAVKAGCVGYEIGGAQFQAGLIRGFDPALVLALGLPSNMPAHSLQRAQYVNGLRELPTEIRQALFDATADVVSGHYRGSAGKAPVVPWHPYNFHAGNFYDEKTGYSPQDETTAELLKAGCCPMPVWVFSAKFPIEALEKWTARQIEIFKKADRQLHCVRIKNPGQGKDWTSEAIWAHIQVMRRVFEAKKLDPPIVYVHNHDFNGRGAHIGAEVFRLAQADGFHTLVIDAAYRKNGTHNDNTVLLAALKLTAEQLEALDEWNHNQQEIENLLCRFDSRTSQMTPWDSDWAGGTEGSDIRIAKEYGVNVRKINAAKEVATEVFPLERAVTPFSEYKLRLGLGILLEAGIEPKTAEKVREWVNAGGKLKVGGDVLIGLKRWETLVPKPAEVDKLLANMHKELEDALAQKSGLIGPADLDAGWTAAQRHTALGYQAKGLEFVKARGTPKDLSPLLLAPHVLHRAPQTLAPGTAFELIVSADGAERAEVTFEGFGATPTGGLTLTFKHGGATSTVTMEPEAAAGGKAGPRKAAGTADELACAMPGELVAYKVKEGDVLVEGQPVCTLESMKMEVVISAPAALAGRAVKSLPARVRTAAAPGAKLSPGDLLLEVQPQK